MSVQWACPLLLHGVTVFFDSVHHVAWCFEFPEVGAFVSSVWDPPVAVSPETAQQ